jgi:hypothetical protein
MKIRTEIDVFKAKLRAAFRAKDLSAQDATWLSVIKTAWSRLGVGLSKEEEKRLTRLARAGGWTSKPIDSTFNYVVDEDAA